MALSTDCPHYIKSEFIAKPQLVEWNEYEYIPKRYYKSQPDAAFNFVLLPRIRKVALWLENEKQKL